MELEWAMSVCIRRQFMMVVGTVFSMFPLRSTSSNSSNLAILLKNKGKEWVELSTKNYILNNSSFIYQGKLDTFCGSSIANMQIWFSFSFNFMSYILNQIFKKIIHTFGNDV